MSAVRVLWETLRRAEVLWIVVPATARRMCPLSLDGLAKKGEPMRLQQIMRVWFTAGPVSPYFHATCC